MSLFVSVGGWLALSVIMLALEVVMPVGVFLVFAVGAGGVAGWLTLFPGAGGWHLALVFAVGAGLGLMVVSALRRRFKWTGDHSENDLEGRAAMMIGQQAVVCEAIRQGKGRVKLGGTYWSVIGPDAEEGTVVRVVRVAGSLGADLEVELVRQNEISKT